MEYASCEPCNHNSRAADTAAAIMARISPTNFIDALELQEARRLLATMTSIAPQFVRELMDPSKVSPVWEKGRDAVFGPKRRIELDGPVSHALLTAFAAKIGMALYREHIGQPLPKAGVVFTQHYLNSGLVRGEAKALVSMMPDSGELKQGRKSSGRLFNYRFNTDERTIVAALVAFNDNFFVRVFATHDERLKSTLGDFHERLPVPVGGLPALASIWNPRRE
ncbi:MAG: hypothetical protein JNM03_11515 [Sphingopyxis sp.]|uniref:hypothetical protein n=1 Tax=Sphingopyxis sp. TaxID=1908224 RepID=UPI001A3C42C1|nr:hypothetical protein [Sphingopyxis sp.]MBL9070602.1 hypothetical protein [Sphingopyxis sp.]